MLHLNEKQIDGLIDAAGVEHTREILEAFWRSSEALLSQLQDYLGNTDFESAKRAAHALRGAAANIGATTVEFNARTVEDACKNGEGVSADTLDLMTADFAEARIAFDAHLKQLS